MRFSVGVGVCVCVCVRVRVCACACVGVILFFILFHIEFWQRDCISEMWYTTSASRSYKNIM